MMTSRFSQYRLASVGVRVGVICLLVNVAIAQSTKTKPNRPATGPSPAAVKALDAKAQKLQNELLKQTQELAKDYEEAGMLDRAKGLYEVILRLDPKVPGIKDKVEKLDDQILGANDFEYDLQPDKGWSPPVAQVYKDRSLRIQVEGDCKIAMSIKGDAEGVNTDSITDMARGIPLGAVMGVFVGADRKPGKPFLIGKKHEVTPREDGALMLRANVPVGSTSSDKFKVKISGYARAVP